ncbi:hypothetical protein [Streptomyces luteolifulvus]|uniref:hypothetical protein n=1 Tax=Streptomyces luteolifulvus TaxID=2615112 RepID=UPI001782D0AD|nr:hypothetical protein [Streptomyces luteolifulvus]
MTITRTGTVAVGKFAPGQLGGLTAIVPFQRQPPIGGEAGQGPGARRWSNFL